MIRARVLALPALFGLLAFRGAGAVVVDPATLAVGGAVVVKLSLACAQALVAAATTCGQAGIAGAIGCAVAYVQVQQSCP